MNIVLTIFSFHRFGTGEISQFPVGTVLWLVQSDPMRVALEAGGVGCSVGESWICVLFGFD